MNSLYRKLFYWCFLLICPLAAAFTLHVFAPSWSGISEPAHSSVEAVGSMIALSVALFILIQRRYQDRQEFPWVSLALISMGILDGVHAISPVNVSFVWTRALATLLGGLLFAGVWIPDRFTKKISSYRSVALVTFCSSILAFLCWNFADSLPPLSIGSSFTWTAKILNLGGGLGFALGSLHFIKRFKISQDYDNILFASHGILFSMAALMFSFAHLWGAVWWFFHFLRLLAYLVVFRYVTETFDVIFQDRKRKEQELSIILEKIPVGVIIANKTGTITRVNHAAQSIWAGINFSNLNQCGDYKGWWPDSGKSIEAKEWPMARAIAERQVSNAEVVDIECFDGSRKTILNAAAPIIVEKDLVGGVAVMQDVTELQTAKRDIYNRDEFISICSHELKTPITAMKLQMQATGRYLERNAAIGEIKLREKLQQIVDLNSRQLDRLVILIDDMLDVSRSISGQLKMNFSRVDLVIITREVIKRFEDQIQEANLVLTCTAPAKAEIQGDSQRMEQVITNLISNAIKYGNGKPVSIEILPQAKVIHWQIRDHGLGIAVENKERIFKRFERAISANLISGMGLGLYITRNIIDAHHGKISVESELGKGSVFTVEVPSV